jgi:hypothetical protein
MYIRHTGVRVYCRALWLYCRVYCRGVWMHCRAKNQHLVEKMPRFWTEITLYLMRQLQSHALFSVRKLYWSVLLLGPSNMNINH